MARRTPRRMYLHALAILLAAMPSSSLRELVTPSNVQQLQFNSTGEIMGEIRPWEPPPRGELVLRQVPDGATTTTTTTITPTTTGATAWRVKVLKPTPTSTSKWDVDKLRRSQQYI